MRCSTGAVQVLNYGVPEMFAIGVVNDCKVDGNPASVELGNRQRLRSTCDMVP